MTGCNEVERRAEAEMAGSKEGAAAVKATVNTAEGAKRPTRLMDQSAIISFRAVSLHGLLVSKRQSLVRFNANMC